MIISVTAVPGSNSYITSLVNAYQDLGHKVICGFHNFFYSNMVPDLLHIHWPELMVSWHPFCEKNNKEKLNEVEQRLSWFKENNVKIILTVHNIKPHENDEFLSNLYKLILGTVDVFVHHCKQSIDKFNLEYVGIKNSKHIIANHGDYLMDYKKVDKKLARKELNISPNKFVILNFGQQRAYKGPGFIEDVFKSLPIKSKFLLNAGIFSYAGMNSRQKYWCKLKNHFNESRKSDLKKNIFRPIKQSELALLFNSADVVFLGHDRGLNSGVLAMSATFSIPIIYPDIGCFKNQTEGWISLSYEVNNKRDAITKISEMHNKITLDKTSYSNENWLKFNSWEMHVNKILGIA